MEKGRHTLKEIGRQKEGLRETCEMFESFDGIIEEVRSENFDKVIFLGCGTSYFLAASASAYFNRFNSIPATHLASYEFFKNTEYYIKNGEKVLLVPFTRVASTSETMNAVKKGIQLPNIKSLQITCDDFSKTYSTWSLYIPGMFENSIVMTLSFTVMLYTAMYFAAKMAKNEKVIEELKKVPDDVDENIGRFESEMKAFAEKEVDSKILIGLGSGEFYGLAGESTIKVKEMSLEPSEVYYSLEYRHGPISIADEKAVIAYFVSKNTADDDLRLIKELKALGSKVVALGSLTDEIKEIADVSFASKLCECAALSEYIIPMQYFGAYLSIARGYDPDVPKNLTKAIIL